MQLYQCKVRLSGSVMNEVFKEEVTAPEILLLRAIHGGDAVVDIAPTKADKSRDDDVERERLFTAYCKDAHPESEVPKHFQRLFGMDFQALPQHIPGVTKGKKAPAVEASVDLG